MEGLVLIFALIGIAFVVQSIIDGCQRRKSEYRTYREKQLQWDEQQARHARQVQLTNEHPVNQAALRWIKEAELDVNSKNPNEVKWLDSEIYVVKYLIWSIDRLDDQGASGRRNGYNGYGVCTGMYVL